MIEFEIVPTGEKGTLENGIFSCPGYEGVLNAEAKNIQPLYNPIKDLGLAMAVMEVYPFFKIVKIPEPPVAKAGTVY